MKQAPRCHKTELGEMTAQCIDRLGALADDEIAGSKGDGHGAASLLTATKRIVGVDLKDFLREIETDYGDFRHGASSRVCKRRSLAQPCHRGRPPHQTPGSKDRGGAQDHRGGYREMETAYRIALKSLARRHLELHDEIADLDAMIKAIVDELAPDLVARNSIGYGSAAQLLITAGDNPKRLRSEASFAALCGVSPIPASSGKTNRHRLNRGGDRAANSALHIIAIGRLRCDARTQQYVARRIADGRSKLEAIRCLKRFIAREVFNLIRDCYRAINPAQIAA